jgi:hypothetical protein
MGTVNVNRNLNRPTFVTPGNLQDTISVKETESFEKVLYKFQGRDTDRRV